MYKSIFILLFLIFTCTNSFAQVKFPYPINTKSHEESPALLPDSSVMVMSDRDGFTKSYRFVFNGKDWESSPNSLTEQINALMYADGAHGNFSFSDDFSRLTVTLHQLKKKNYFEIEKQNGKWGLFKEIIKGQDLDKDEQRDHTPLKYTTDLSKMYVIDPSHKPYNVIYYYQKTENGWSDRKEINYFQREFDVIWGSIVPIGNDGLLFATPPSVNKNVSNTGGDLFFYTKQISDNEWTAPRFIRELSIDAHILNLSLTASKSHFTYSLFSEGDVYMIEVPEFLKDEMAITRTTSSKEIIPTLNNIAVPSKKKTIKPTGNYYALLIGNSDYNVDELDLDKPTQDVDELANILSTMYAFDESNIVKLINSDRNSTLQELYRLRQTLTPDDNLLIFYAGHGHWDDQIGQGYWWPVDATLNNPSNWLSNSDLREQIRGINSAHTLLISDACFSGGIFKTRGVNDIRSADLDIQLLYRMQSRRAITSGTMSTVPDESVFFKYFIKYLSENDKKFISSSELFTIIRASVLNNSMTVPQDGVILNTGDEGGDFIFIKK
ncbi:MAG: caspase family protein [Cyclobacteriaceae bacterium]|nr:caspase family protein [Cyclobacteriaceae bacterium]